jgi:hypothetical protein
MFLFFVKNFVFDEQTEQTPNMLTETHTQRVLDLARQKGLLRARDLDAIAAPRVVLTRLTATGLLDRIGRGLYRLPSHPGSEHEGLAAIATKVPQAVFCLLTALQFHELTTQLPRQIWIAMPRGSHVPRIDYPPIKMVQMTGEVYTAGVEEHLRDGVLRMKLRAATAGYILRKWSVDCSPDHSLRGYEYRLWLKDHLALYGVKNALLAPGYRSPDSQNIMGKAD